VSRIAEAVRRGADVVAGLVGLTVTAPVLAAAAVAIRLTMGRGVLFRQRRSGLGGRPFDVLKLRTMRHPVPGREGPQYDGERLTSVGRFLRSTSIDELPSLVNLIRGDITLVGPRPLPVGYLSRYTAAERRRLEVKPGITGLAVINGRNDTTWDERLAWDVRYVENRSLLGDVRIMAQTVPLVLRRRGISQPGAVTMSELPERR
jgi:lipopolysaccharide/colanic/teichoic acid biosynthesis glycosyltransferase